MAEEVSLTSLLQSRKEELVEHIWKAAPDLKKIIISAQGLSAAREGVFAYLNALERSYFNIYSQRKFRNLHILDRNLAKECIRVFKNVIRTENELLSGYSALQGLYHLARGDKPALKQLSSGFLLEFYHLILGINGKAMISRRQGQTNSDTQAGDDYTARAADLNAYSDILEDRIGVYSRQWDESRHALREAFIIKILEHFKANRDDWQNPFWHIRNVIREKAGLEKLIKLNDSEVRGLDMATANKISFQITPYYLSLFNPAGRDESDRSARAQVLPSETYCRNVRENQRCGLDMDFMGEQQTSPVENITRRYAQIVILKPYDSCPQICVYCQRNWEIKSLEDARVTPASIDKSIRWIRQTPAIREVLVTGGDPLTLPNAYLDRILGKLADIAHVERIRIGSRAPVTLPSRFEEGLLAILAKYHEPGKREIVLMTHFQHAHEITPETTVAATAIRRLGISIYNQQVFTYFNSRRFETCHLRKKLKINGIDPYYSFNTKGKEETVDFRVPMARIEQERKEEARILPGIIRTDEPVFNVPRLGKSHLRAWQDHEPIMILPDGKRVYRFYPWESMIAMTQDYLYTDVSITDYLQRLLVDGENPDDYASIWYYF